MYTRPLRIPSVAAFGDDDDDNDDGGSGGGISETEKTSDDGKVFARKQMAAASNQMDLIVWPVTLMQQLNK